MKGLRWEDRGKRALSKGYRENSNYSESLTVLPSNTKCV